MKCYYLIFEKNQWLAMVNKFNYIKSNQSKNISFSGSQIMHLRPVTSSTKDFSTFKQPLQSLQRFSLEDSSCNAVQKSSYLFYTAFCSFRFFSVVVACSTGFVLVSLAFFDPPNRGLATLSVEFLSLIYCPFDFSCSKIFFGGYNYIYNSLSSIYDLTSLFFNPFSPT